MNTLILLRHGKSDWDVPHETDHERPLAGRGRKASKLMGRFLASLEQIPDLVLSSSAVRAAATAKLAAEAGRWRCPLEVSDELYDAGTDDVIHVLRELDDDNRTVLLVGHEPTWSDLAGRLVGTASLRLPTAAMARIDFEIDTWASVGPGRGTLIWMVTPRLLDRAKWTLRSK